MFCKYVIFFGRLLGSNTTKHVKIDRDCLTLNCGLFHIEPHFPLLCWSAMLAGTSFQFFPEGGGQNFDRLPKGGQHMKKTKCCVQKHKKILFF